jgi:hypothetical protein
MLSTMYGYVLVGSDASSLVEDTNVSEKHVLPSSGYSLAYLEVGGTKFR